MTKIIAVVVLASFLIIPTAFARGRTGSKRGGGYNSHGKGGHYIGGHVASGPAKKSRRRKR